MSVGVGGQEGQTEILRDRLLQDCRAFAPLIGAERFDFFVRANRRR